MRAAKVVSVDGRRVRSAKSREAIVDAAMALLDDGGLRLSASLIASRAGLSVRSVFQHFCDLEDLFLAVADRQTDRIASLYTGTDYRGDIDARVDVFVAYRANLYETIAPIRRAAMLQEPFSPIIASRMELGRSLHRLDLERAFGAELDAARTAGDTILPDALAAATSFTAWDDMRRFLHLDLAAATATLHRMVSALLGAATR